MEGYSSQLTDEPGNITDEAADAMADFTLDLFRAANDPTDNTVLSPLSALYALAMLANGAKGETRAQLEQAFGMSVEELDRTLRAFSARLPDSDEATDVNLANSIWIRSGFTVKPQFLQDNADYLDAGVFQAPFDDETVAQMNAWVSEQTEGMIPQLIQELSPQTVLALINALYFHSEWLDPYTDYQVTDGSFYPEAGKVQDARMMRSSERTYLKDAQATGFIKNFKSSKYAFAVVVPNEGVDLNDYIGSLDGESLRKLLKGVRDSKSYEVIASMPKFKSETTVHLNEPLAGMGIRDAFDANRADLSGIAPDLAVSTAMQKAVIEVDEKGVSAAAATFIGVDATSAPMTTYTVTADRPYLYMIIDRTTNLPLFIGTTLHLDSEVTAVSEPGQGTKNLMAGYSGKLDVSPGAITDKAADAMADFTLDLFRASEKPGESTVMSPASVLCALAMLANGAEGNTRAQLEQAFGMSVSELNEAMRSFIANLPEQYGKSEIHLANSVWVRDGFRVKSQFLQDNADYLNAGIFQAPFDDSTVRDINNWISENTDGMIPQLISQLDPNIVLALVNALYLKAQWHDPYAGTVQIPFYSADGTARKAEMLSSRETTYLHDGSAVGFIKPFASDKYAFAVVVPNEGVDLDEYIAGLDGPSLRALLTGERYDAVYAKMPKFKQETFVNLSKPLQALGITDAFNPLRADLSGIAPDLVVSQAQHKAIIEVNEHGVSAAAATYIGAGATSVGPGDQQKIAYVTADRPYLYMIIDKTTNLPLFIGTTTRTDGEPVTNPIPDPTPVEPTPEPMRTVDLMEGYTCQAAEAPGAISDEAADAMADFTLNMLRAAGDPDQNTVLSPLSALYALDMLGNGAKGRTRAQLEQTFGLPVSELNETLRSVTANLPEGYGSTNVHLANSIWIHTGFEVEPQFLQDNADYLDAGAFQAPFDGQTLRDINAWISEQTEGMIPEMLRELSPDTMVALINALYFCGQWAEPYQTVTYEPFYPADGSVQTAEMMHSSERIYLKDVQAQGFIKTFHSDKYAFAVVVPNKGVSLDEYVAGLDGKRLRRLLKGGTAVEVNAAMPKFSAETFADLNEPLQAMGIRDAFVPGIADLSGIAGDLYVSKSLQKAVIEVDEKGVSAAAATVITLEKNASPAHASVTVTADRP
ncbi:MAG: serpin family protein, partial [Oscillospiraceae bacterium]|nr:serpin family protein [Oscillospiraceae bacterium]